MGSYESETLIPHIACGQGEGGNRPVIPDNEIGFTRLKVPQPGFTKLLKSGLAQFGGHGGNGMKGGRRGLKKLEKIPVELGFLHGFAQGVIDFV
jgi:hypothetical protein